MKTRIIAFFKWIWSLLVAVYKLLKAIKNGTYAAFFSRWKEYMPFVVSLIVWIIMGPIIRLLSPTSGVDDVGLLQALVFGLVLFFAACAFSWFALRIIFPTIGKFVDDLMSDILSYQKEETRIWVSIVVFAVYFFGAIIILASCI